MVCEWFGPKTT
jgi:hypothetical protein